MFVVTFTSLGEFQLVTRPKRKGVIVGHSTTQKRIECAELLLDVVGLSYHGKHELDGTFFVVDPTKDVFGKNIVANIVVVVFVVVAGCCRSEFLQNGFG